MHIYITVVALVQRPLATAFETIMSPHLFKCDFNIFWNDYFHINPYIRPDEFELMLKLRFGFKRCSRPFSGSDLLEIWEGTSELSDKLPSPHSNIVRCYKQCTCVLMWQQISGKALRCTALAIQITRQLWSIPHFGICVIIQIVFCISYLESRTIISWRNKLARLYIDACNNIIACFLKYVTPLTW